MTDEMVSVSDDYMRLRMRLDYLQGLSIEYFCSGTTPAQMHRNFLFIQDISARYIAELGQAKHPGKEIIECEPGWEQCNGECVKAGCCPGSGGGMSAS